MRLLLERYDLPLIYLDFNFSLLSNFSSLVSDYRICGLLPDPMGVRTNDPTFETIERLGIVASPRVEVA